MHQKFVYLHNLILATNNQMNEKLLDMEDTWKYLSRGNKILNSIISLYNMLGKTTKATAQSVK